MSQGSENRPSSMQRIFLCPGSRRQEANRPNLPTPHTVEGHGAHEAAAICLQSGAHPADLIGERIAVEGGEVLVTPEMAGYVETYINTVMQYHQGDGLLLVERRVDFSRSLGVDDGWGTPDASVVKANEYQIHDLKYGRSVRVDAPLNPQLALYALGLLDEFGSVGIERVVMVIHQPRLNHVSEWVATLDELARFAARTKAVIEIASRPDAPLIPGEEQCRFCKAKAYCPALTDLVMEEFEALSQPKHADNARLGQACSKVPLIEQWCSAVTAEAERRLLKGDAVPGVKLVRGKKGPRKWSDADRVGQLLKNMRLPDADIFDTALISPASAEKLFQNNTIGPRQWASLQPWITQVEGRPTVAPASDPRPEFDPAPTADLFEPLETSALN